MNINRQELLKQQHTFRQNPITHAKNEIAVVLLKPDYLPQHVRDFKAFLRAERLSTVYDRTVRLEPACVLAIYNDIFRFSENDIRFGYGWKQRKLAYMSSGETYVACVAGINAQTLCEKFKYEMREKYGKLSVPDRKLSNDEFEELAIKNIIHVVDSAETEVAIWLLTNGLAEDLRHPLPRRQESVLYSAA